MWSEISGKSNPAVTGSAFILDRNFSFFFYFGWNSVFFPFRLPYWDVREEILHHLENRSLYHALILFITWNWKTSFLYLACYVGWYRNLFLETSVKTTVVTKAEEEGLGPLKPECHLTSNLSDVLWYRSPVIQRSKWTFYQPGPHPCAAVAAALRGNGGNPILWRLQPCSQDLPLFLLSCPLQDSTHGQSKITPWLCFDVLGFSGAFFSFQLLLPYRPEGLRQQRSLGWLTPLPPGY